MLRIMVIAFLPVLLVAAPAAAITTQEKMETCKVGAESVEAAKRATFIKKCMAKGNYEPPARKNAKTAPKPQ
jgi:hypothetical protein